MDGSSTSRDGSRRDRRRFSLSRMFPRNRGRSNEGRPEASPRSFIDDESMPTLDDIDPLQSFVMREASHLGLRCEPVYPISETWAALQPDAPNLSQEATSLVGSIPSHNSTFIGYSSTPRRPLGYTRQRFERIPTVYARRRLNFDAVDDSVEIPAPQMSAQNRRVSFPVPSQRSSQLAERFFEDSTGRPTLPADTTYNVYHPTFQGRLPEIGSFDSSTGMDTFLRDVPTFPAHSTPIRSASRSQRCRISPNITERNQRTFRCVSPSGNEDLIINVSHQLIDSSSNRPESLDAVSISLVNNSFPCNLQNLGEVLGNEQFVDELIADISAQLADSTRSTESERIDDVSQNLIDSTRSTEPELLANVSQNLLDSTRSTEPELLANVMPNLVDSSGSTEPERLADVSANLIDSSGSTEPELLVNVSPNLVNSTRSTEPNMLQDESMSLVQDSLGLPANISPPINQRGIRYLPANRLFESPPANQRRCRFMESSPANQRYLGDESEIDFEESLSFRNISLPVNQRAFRGLSPPVNQRYMRNLPVNRYLQSPPENQRFLRNLSPPANQRDLKDSIVRRMMSPPANRRGLRNVQANLYFQSPPANQRFLRNLAPPANQRGFEDGLALGNLSPPANQRFLRNLPPPANQRFMEDGLVVGNLSPPANQRFLRNLPPPANQRFMEDGLVVGNLSPPANQRFLRNLPPPANQRGFEDGLALGNLSPPANQRFLRNLPPPANERGFEDGFALGNLSPPANQRFLRNLPPPANQIDFGDGFRGRCVRRNVEDGLGIRNLPPSANQRFLRNLPPLANQIDFGDGLRGRYVQRDIEDGLAIGNLPPPANQRFLRNVPPPANQIDFGDGLRGRGVRRDVEDGLANGILPPPANQRFLRNLPPPANQIDFGDGLRGRSVRRDVEDGLEIGILPPPANQRFLRNLPPPANQIDFGDGLRGIGVGRDVEDGLEIGNLPPPANQRFLRNLPPPANQIDLGDGLRGRGIRGDIEDGLAIGNLPPPANQRFLRNLPPVNQIDLGDGLRGRGVRRVIEDGHAFGNLQPPANQRFLRNLPPPANQRDVEAGLAIGNLPPPANQIDLGDSLGGRCVQRDADDGLAIANLPPPANQRDIEDGLAMRRRMMSPSANQRIPRILPANRVSLSPPANQRRLRDISINRPLSPPVNQRGLDGGLDMSNIDIPDGVLDDMIEDLIEDISHQLDSSGSVHNLSQSFGGRSPSPAANQRYYGDISTRRVESSLNRSYNFPVQRIRESRRFSAPPAVNLSTSRQCPRSNMLDDISMNLGDTLDSSLGAIPAQDFPTNAELIASLLHVGPPEMLENVSELSFIDINSDTGKQHISILNESFGRPRNAQRDRENLEFESPSSFWDNISYYSDVQQNAVPGPSDEFDTFERVVMGLGRPSTHSSRPSIHGRPRRAGDDRSLIQDTSRPQEIIQQEDEVLTIEGPENSRSWRVAVQYSPVFDSFERDIMGLTPDMPPASLDGRQNAPVPASHVAVDDNLSVYESLEETPNLFNYGNLYPTADSSLTRASPGPSSKCPRGIPQQSSTLSNAQTFNLDDSTAGLLRFNPPAASTPKKKR